MAWILLRRHVRKERKLDSSCDRLSRATLSRIRPDRAKKAHAKGYRWAFWLGKRPALRAGMRNAESDAAAILAALRHAAEDPAYAADLESAIRRAQYGSVGQTRAYRVAVSLVDALADMRRRFQGAR